MEDWTKRFTFTFVTHPEFRLWPDLYVQTIEPWASGTYVPSSPTLGHQDEPIWRTVTDVLEEIGNELPVAVTVELAAGNERFEQQYVPATS